MSDPHEHDEVDPRYAAVFQRGYDPARHPTPTAESDPAVVESGPALPASDPALAEATRPAAGPVDPPDDTGHPGTVELAQEPDAVPPRRSGWRRALPVGAASLVLLVAAVLLVLVPAPAESSFALSFPALLRATLQPALALGGGVGLAVAIVVAALRIDDTADADQDSDPADPEGDG